MKDKKTMTFDEVISRFEKTFPFLEIDDCRPAWPEVYGTGGFGITVWLKNGDKVLYYPNAEAEPTGQLRPCPFCGSDARVSRLLGYGFMDTKIIYQISCDASCKGNPSVAADTMEDAAREWNRRAKEWEVEAGQNAKDLAERIYEQIEEEADYLHVDRKCYFEKVVQYMRAESEE